MEPFDPSRPNIARVWDYWLGGKDNFAADRELAHTMLAINPLSALMARENRQFLGHAVTYVAAHGVRQFIDVGAGLPTAVNTHDIARRVDRQAPVAYVDNDPLVISHARNLLARSPGVIAVPRRYARPRADTCRCRTGGFDRSDRAGLRDPLRRPALRSCRYRRDVAAAFARAMVPTSYLVVSVGSGNKSEGENFTSAYDAAPIYIHSMEAILSFFDGLELIPPGVVPVRGWHGDEPALDMEPRTAAFLGGLARKP